jgi:NADH-quinone oxidoreductase subunit G/NADP-reducing hydrogenase subunit HndD
MQITIDGKKFEAKDGATILEAARNEGISIPTLCNNTDLSPIGNCRICICEVDGKLKSACDTKVEKNMDIKTKSEKVVASRKINIELLLARHGIDGPESNELLKLKKEYGIGDKIRFDTEKDTNVYNNISNAIYREPSLCILCGKCVYTCRITQQTDAICFENRGKDLKIGTAFNHNLIDTSCTECGQCTMVCPTDAFREVDDIDKVKAAINDPNCLVIAQTAPSVRASIGEEFGLPPGHIVKKQLVAGLRKLGFDKVFDTNFGADLTIVEEASELLKRINEGDTLPQTTSCCPSYVTFVEKFYPDLIPHLSTCKSPHQMLGAVVKTYFAQKNGIDPSKIILVSIMPCTSKKSECKRKGMDSSGFQDVDLVLTTRETARLLKQEGIDLTKIKEEEYDPTLGDASGAGMIFGSTGGVMEATIRTAYEFATKEKLKDIEFEVVRGLKGIKSGSLKLKDKTINFAVANGLNNAKILLDEIKNGTSKYHIIEIMACQGGCLGGGGQPKPTNKEIREKRMKAIYQEDRDLPIRKSHENPAIKELYDQFLKKPLGEKSEALLHTKYERRKKL